MFTKENIREQHTESLNIPISFFIYIAGIFKDFFFYVKFE